eukprot:12698561-Alexandrium_andersonii.AAC.1
MLADATLRTEAPREGEEGAAREVPSTSSRRPVSAGSARPAVLWRAWIGRILSHPRPRRELALRSARHPGRGFPPRGVPRRQPRCCA